MESQNSDPINQPKMFLTLDGIAVQQGEIGEGRTEDSCIDVVQRQKMPDHRDKY